MSRRRFTPPTPPSEEWGPEQEQWFRDNNPDRPDHNRSPPPSEEHEARHRRQWLGYDQNHPNLNDEPDFIFPSPETYRRQQQLLQNPQTPPLAPGIAFHVHDVFDNIRDNEREIMETLGGPHPDLYIFEIGPTELVKGFHESCVRILRKHYSSQKLVTELDKLKKIITKLDLAKEYHLHNENISSVFTSIQFVMRQPDVFQKYYVDLFIEDTFNAYNGKEDTISCPKGIVERMLFAIADACLLYCITYKKKRKQKKNKTRKNKTGQPRNTVIPGGSNSTQNISQYKKCDNPIYRKLIRLFKKEVPDINSLTREWARIFEDTDEVANMGAEELKKNFIKFMTRKYISYGLTQTNKIMERANQFEELKVFEKKAFY